MNTFSKGTVGLATARLVTQILGMLNTMLLSRASSLQEYGTYSQIFVIINLSVSIVGMGLPDSINYFLARHEENKKHFVSCYISLITTLSVIVGILSIVIIPVYARYFNNIDLVNYGYMMLLLPWSTLMLSSADTIFVSENRVKWLMLLKIVNSVINVSLALLFCLDLLYFNHYLIFYVSGQLALTLVVILLIYKLYYGLTFKLNYATVCQIMKISVPIGLAGIAGMLKTEMDKLVIGKFYSTDKMAVYSNVSKELPIAILSAVISTMAFPQIAKLVKNRKMNEAIKAWGDLTIVSLAITGFFIAGVFVFAKEAIVFLYSEKYVTGISVFRIYLLVLVFRITYFGIILNSMGETKSILKCTIISLVCNVALNYILYFLIGFEGPAIATWIASAVAACSQLIITSKKSSIKFSKVLPWKDLLFVLGINVVFALFFWMLKVFLCTIWHIGEVSKAFILATVWAMCYFVIMYKYLKKHWSMATNEMEQDG